MPNIPDQSQWPKHPLDDLVSDERPICYGVLKPGEYARDGVRLLRITDLEANTIDERNLYRINHALDAEFARSRLLGGELLLSIQGTIGRVAIVPPTLREANISRTLARIALCNDANSSFYRYWFLSDIGQRALTDATVGTTRNSLNINALRAIVVPHPEISEQARIAATLDAVDESIAKTSAVIAKLKQVRAGLLYDLLTHGLDENGQLRDPITHPEQFQDSPLGRIPREWEVRTIEQVNDPSAPVCYGIVQAFEFVPDGVPVLTIRDLLGDYLTGIHRTARSIDANYKRSRVCPGDVLISVKGTIGRVDIVPQHFRGNISRDLARVRPNDLVRAKFLVHLLRSQGGQRTLELSQVGTTRAELSIAPLKRLSFAFPLTGEQEQIAMVLDEHDALIRSHEHELEKLISIKSGLMNDLLTGRVRVPE